MLNLEKLISKKEFKRLHKAILNSEVVKVKVNAKIINKIYDINKLNQHLNKNVLIYPYVSLNNHNSSTCKHDLIKRTKNKHMNSLETKLSKKSILFRIAQGDTLVVNYLQEYDDNVEFLTNFLGNKLNSNCNVNLYYSYKNTLGINLHFDLHDILAIQIYGQKKWTIVKQSCDISQIIEKSKLPNLDKIDKNKIEYVETNVGDILYIPKGIWHKAQTIDDSSIHFALSLNPLRSKDFIKYFLTLDFENLSEKNLYDLSPQNIKKEFRKIFEKLEKKLNNYSEDEALNLLSNLSLSENINLRLS